MNILTRKNMFIPKIY